MNFPFGLDPNRKLPIGIQDFEDLRTKGYLYVDKTAYIYRLLHTGKPYFLGRPRRFGKSLFLSTLKYFFLGRKELFEGLAIYDLEKDWIEYPVLYLDFNSGLYRDCASLELSLDSNLRVLEEKWERNPEDVLLSIRFANIIRRACEQSGGRKVVVLIDEYDKPLLSVMDNESEQDKMRTVLKSFYGVLKSSDQYLKFAMLTGVTKFSQVSIFSDLNHLLDISMDEEYAGICGISETELHATFTPEVEALAAKRNMSVEATFAELKKRYDGYHFSKDIVEGMYNPFSLLYTFKRRDFVNEWFKTGTPTFLIKMLKKADYDLPKLEGDVVVTEQYVTDYRTDNADPIPVLYQSGYLTIKSYETNIKRYLLGFPNEEVKYGFLNELLPTYLNSSQIKTDFDIGLFVRDLCNGHLDAFMIRLTAFFAAIPYDLENKKEKHYQTVFYLFLTLMGQLVKVEPHSSAGSADAVVELPDAVYIFEFKIDGNGTAKKALQQIDKRGYALPYAASGKRIVKVGAVFDAKTRTIGKWLTA